VEGVGGGITNAVASIGPRTRRQVFTARRGETNLNCTVTSLHVAALARGVAGGALLAALILHELPIHGDAAHIRTEEVVRAVDAGTPHLHPTLGTPREQPAVLEAKVEVARRGVTKEALNTIVQRLHRLIIQAAVRLEAKADIEVEA